MFYIAFNVRTFADVHLSSLEYLFLEELKDAAIHEEECAHFGQQ